MEEKWKIIGGSLNFILPCHILSFNIFNFQGRMLGNPYSSSDSSLGPLMREIKNKICRDCELVALLEDDNGMELLVNFVILCLL